ncbi:hypothetical protein G7054_g2479 [Neopestalotiopsis clavispora]|nr:hypothetical protein G7054_g2479 [Neopestalotiopsis clavispora]
MMPHGDEEIHLDLNPRSRIFGVCGMTFPALPGANSGWLNQNNFRAAIFSGAIIRTVTPAAAFILGPKNPSALHSDETRIEYGIHQNFSELLVFISYTTLFSPHCTFLFVGQQRFVPRNDIMNRRAAASKGPYVVEHEDRSKEPRVAGDCDSKPISWYQDATDSSSATARMMLIQWLATFAIVGGLWWCYFDEIRAILQV